MKETTVEENNQQTSLSAEEEKKAEKARKKLAREEKKKNKVKIGKPHYCSNCQEWTRPVRLPKNPNKEKNHTHTTNKLLIIFMVIFYPIGICYGIYNLFYLLFSFLTSHKVCEKCHLKYDDNVDYSEKRDTYQNKRAYETSKFSNLGEMEVKVEAVKALKDAGADYTDMMAVNGDPLLAATLKQNQPQLQQPQATPQRLEAPKQTAADRLKEAHQMHKDGIIDEQEFKEIKQKLMKEM